MIGSGHSMPVGLLPIVPIVLFVLVYAKSCPGDSLEASSSLSSPSKGLVSAKLCRFWVETVLQMGLLPLGRFWR